MKVPSLPQSLREVELVLRNLDFLDNFKAFQVADLDIGAGAEVAIQNLITPTVPSRWTLLRVARTGSGTVSIVDGVKLWTPSTLYIQNIGTSSARVTIAFFA